MRKIHFCLALVFALTSLHLSAQETVRYLYTREKKDNEKVSILNANGIVFKVNPIRKTESGKKIRRFTLNDAPYKWVFEKRKPSLLYAGDSLVAEASDKITINGESFTVTQPSKSTFIYRLNGKDVARGTVLKNGSKFQVNITFENEVARNQALQVAAAYYGVSLVERRPAAGGNIVGFLAGFAVGYGVTSLVLQ